MELNEMQWNYHLSNLAGSDKEQVHNKEPYGSDNRYMMYGRDTGHFGSGTYFSTYDTVDPDAKWKNNEVSDHTPEFIKIAKNVYRVDLDFYKNLYRVYGKRHGDVLFTLLSNVNKFFYRINTDFGKFNKKNAVYANSELYQKIKANSDALGLKCPSYYKLTRMAQEHDGIQSFSTVFMEYNGFNGVNVSGVPFYDNTMHGSVVYDLSKTDGIVKQATPKNLWNVDDHGHSDSVVIDMDDIAMNALAGKTFLITDKLGSLNGSALYRVLKNSAMSRNPLDVYYVEKLEPDAQKRFLKYMYDNRKGDMMFSDRRDAERWIKMIIDNGALYWVNYDGGDTTGLIAVLRELDDWSDDDKKRWKKNRKTFREFFRYMKRCLTWSERKWLKDYIGIYLDENGNCEEK